MRSSLFEVFPPMVHLLIAAVAAPVVVAVVAAFVVVHQNAKTATFDVVFKIKNKLF